MGEVGRLSELKVNQKKLSIRSDRFRRIRLSLMEYVRWWVGMTLIVGFVVLVSSCSRPPQQSSSASCENILSTYLDNTIAKERTASNIELVKEFAIFVDSSESMRGFAAIEGSVFENLIANVEGSLLALSQTAERRFFKFGADVVSISRDEFLGATQSRFYGMTDTNITTAIRRAEGIGKNSLSVIITDFFQSDHDINLMAETLQDVQRQNGWAMGILAVRSDFSGWVFDVGQQRDKFNYSKPSSKRPLYIIVLGQYEYVKQFLERLASLSNLKEDTENNLGFVIFSNKVLEAPLTYAKLSEGNMVRLKSCSVNNPECCKIFKLKDESKDSHYFRQEFLIPYMPHVLKPSFVPTTVKVIRCDNSCKLVEDPAIASAFKITPIRQEGNSLLLEARVKSRLLATNAVYLLEVVMIPVFSEKNCPNWFRDLDMDVSQLPDWRKEPDSFDGSKTYNLGRAMKIFGQLNSMNSSSLFIIIKKGRG